MHISHVKHPLIKEVDGLLETKALVVFRNVAHAMSTNGCGKEHRYQLLLNVALIKT